MVKTILTDGRHIQADECMETIDAIYGLKDLDGIWAGPEIIKARTTQTFSILCQCCYGSGTHSWSPASYFNGASGPDSGEYTCGTCVGAGNFEFTALDFNTLVVNGWVLLDAQQFHSQT